MRRAVTLRLRAARLMRLSVPPKGRAGGLVALICLAAAGAGMAACGGSGAASSHTPSPGSSSPSGASQGPGVTSPASSRTVSVYFLQGAGNDQLLVAAHRTIPATSLARRAVAALLAGPDTTEKEAGYVSFIPAGTHLLGITVARGIATVDLDDVYESGEGALSMTARLGQVVYTLTQFASIRRVRFAIDGAPVSVFSDEGIAVDTPQGRADYEDITPPILIESPAIGDAVRSPLVLTGTANVFAERFDVELVDDAGRMLARQTISTDSGTGTRHSFSTSLSFAATSTKATLVAVDLEAGATEPVFVTRVPLMLRQ